MFVDKFWELTVGSPTIHKRLYKRLWVTGDKDEYVGGRQELKDGLKLERIKNVEYLITFYLSLTLYPEFHTSHCEVSNLRTHPH